MPDLSGTKASAGLVWGQYRALYDRRRSLSPDMSVSRKASMGLIHHFLQGSFARPERRKRIRRALLGGGVIGLFSSLCRALLPDLSVGECTTAVRVRLLPLELLAFLPVPEVRKRISRSLWGGI